MSEEDMGRPAFVGSRKYAWLLMALIAGCGGGSGGSGTSGNPGSAVSPGGGAVAVGGTGTAGGLAGAVTVGAPTPGKITATRIVGDVLGAVKLTGVVSGDVESLQDKPIFVVVEDPSRLFLERGQLTLVRTATGLTYELVLSGRELTTSSHLSGNLRVLACLDTACKQPLAGTPLVVPYDVTVDEGLTLSREDVTVTVPFGTVPSVETVTVGRSPSLSQGYSAINTTPINPYVPKYVSILPSEGTLLADPQLQLRIKPAPPGAYTETVEVRTTANLYASGSLSFSKIITVHYNVTPNPNVDYIVAPAGPIELTHAASDRRVSFYPYQLVLGTGVTASYLGVDYVSGAGTTGPATSWWDEPGYHAAYYTCIDANCLVPGVYTAKIRYRITAPRGSYDIAIPVKLTATP